MRPNVCIPMLRAKFLGQNQTYAGQSEMLLRQAIFCHGRKFCLSLKNHSISFLTARMDFQTDFLQMIALAFCEPKENSNAKSELSNKNMFILKSALSSFKHLI